MFVFWLGTDVGVMLCSKKSVDPALSIEARFQMLESIKDRATSKSYVGDGTTFGCISQQHWDI